MPAALIGGAIAAVGGIGSAIISNKGASKAADATTQAANQATGFQTDMYNRNALALQPWQQSGLAANRQIDAMLGIGGAQQMVSQAPAGEFGMGGQGLQGPQNTMGANPWDGFKSYLAGSDYAFQFDRGANALNSGYAGSGMVKSGAAMKGLEQFRQGLQSGYRGEYMGALGNQQALGFNAASAQAGVGQNTANNLSNIAMSRGESLANSALVKSQNTANALGGAFNTGAYLYGRYG